MQTPGSKTVEYPVTSRYQRLHLILQNLKAELENLAAEGAALLRETDLAIDRQRVEELLNKIKNTQE